MSEEQRAAARGRSERISRWLEQGVSPDTVGEMVLRGVQGNQRYILTDRIMGPLIEARTKALLDAMPAE